MHRRYVAVCGASEATPSQLEAAREVGKLLARAGAVVINGGFGGVMGAASEGAAVEGGTVVGILPDPDRAEANTHLTIAIATVRCVLASARSGSGRMPTTVPPSTAAPSLAAPITPPKPPLITTAPARARSFPTSRAASSWDGVASEAPHTAT